MDMDNETQVNQCGMTPSPQINLCNNEVSILADDYLAAAKQLLVSAGVERALRSEDEREAQLMEMANKLIHNQEHLRERQRFADFHEREMVAHRATNERIDAFNRQIAQNDEVIAGLEGDKIRLELENTNLAEMLGKANTELKKARQRKKPVLKKTARKKA